MCSRRRVSSLTSLPAELGMGRPSSKGVAVARVPAWAPGGQVADKRSTRLRLRVRPGHAVQLADV